jgi:hypothetical protein
LKSDGLVQKIGRIAKNEPKWDFFKESNDLGGELEAVPHPRAIALQGTSIAQRHWFGVDAIRRGRTTDGDF